MSEQRLPAGSIFIEYIKIKSDITNVEYDLKPIVQEMSVYESVNEPFMTADLVIADALALTTVMPIIGQEIVQIKFKTPHDSVLAPVEVAMRVLSIENMSRTNSKSKMVTYVMHLASVEYFEDIKNSIMEAFRETPISEMVTKIHKSYLLSEKELKVSTTDLPRTIVVPNMIPTKAIKFLSREAFSVEYPSSNFVFFENADGFNFVTLDELISRRHAVVDKYYANTKNLDNKLSDREIAKTGRGGGGRQSNKPRYMMNMTSFEFIHLFNTDKTAKSGGWENSTYFIDPIFSEFTVKEYDYHTDHGNLKHIGKGGKLISKDNHMVSDHKSMQNFFMTNASGSGVDKDQKPNFFSAMMGSFGLMDSVLVEVQVPGDTDRRTGDIIALQFPEYTTTEDVEGNVNKYVSGKYMVVGIRHLYNAEGYAIVMQCIKNGYDEETIPSNPGESESEGELNATMPDKDTSGIDANDATPVGPVWPNSNGEKI